MKHYGIDRYGDKVAVDLEDDEEEEENFCVMCGDSIRQGESLCDCCRITFEQEAKSICDFYEIDEEHVLDGMCAYLNDYV